MYFEGDACLFFPLAIFKIFRYGFGFQHMYYSVVLFVFICLGFVVNYLNMWSLSANTALASFFLFVELQTAHILDLFTSKIKNAMDFMFFLTFPALLSLSASFCLFPSDLSSFYYFFIVVSDLLVNPPFELLILIICPLALEFLFLLSSSLPTLSILSFSSLNM